VRTLNKEKVVRESARNAGQGAFTTVPSPPPLHTAPDVQLLGD